MKLKDRKIKNTHTRLGFSVASELLSTERKAGGCNSSSRSFEILIKKKLK